MQRCSISTIMTVTLLFAINPAQIKSSSDNGLYHSSITYGGGMEYFIVAFSLCDQDGNVMYTKEKPNALAFYISDSGIVYALDEKHLYLYAKNGEEVLLKNLNCPNGFGFSPDNCLFFASDKDGIFAYANDGELIYQFNPGRLFSSTIKGRMVTIISTDTLFVYENGVRKFSRKLSTPYTRGLSFSDDEKSIMIEIPSGIVIFSSQTGERLGVK